MSGPSPREWRFYIDDMISFAEKDNDTLWSIVVSDVPALLAALRGLKRASA